MSENQRNVIVGREVRQILEWAGSKLSRNMTSTIGLLLRFGFIGVNPMQMFYSG